MSPVFKKYPFV